MLLPLKREANDFLLKIIETLDITDTQYGIAERRYKKLGEHLIRDDSPLRLYCPTIHPQGSFMLGTVVKPLDVDEFDIDLVCEVDISKNAISQKDLKMKIVMMTPRLKQMMGPSVAGCFGRLCAILIKR